MMSHLLICSLIYLSLMFVLIRMKYLKVWYNVIRVEILNLKRKINSSHVIVRLDPFKPK